MPDPSLAGSLITPIGQWNAIDIVPTLLDCLGVEQPGTVKGVSQIPVQGVTMRYSFDAATIPSARKTQVYSMLGTRAIWQDGWKAVTTRPALSGWACPGPHPATRPDHSTRMVA